MPRTKGQGKGMRKIFWSVAQDELMWNAYKAGASLKQIRQALLETYKVDRTSGALTARLARLRMLYDTAIVDEQDEPVFALANNKPWVSPETRRELDAYWFRMHRSRYQPQNPSTDISTASS